MNKTKIKNLRKKLGLSTAELGARVGVSRRTVEDWEQGRRNPGPSAKILLKNISKS